MDDYKPNSNRFKQEQAEKRSENRKIERVIKNDVVVKKKSGMSKFKDAIISDDAGSLKSYLINDILIPTIKNTFADIIKNGTDIIFFGERGRHGKSRSTASTVSYRNYYDSKNDRRDDSYASRRDSLYDFDDILFKTYADADDQIEMMCDVLDHYNSLSVADFYESVNKASLIRYTDYDYGWTSANFDQRRVKPIRVRDGYIIDLPRVIPLKR